MLAGNNGNRMPFAKGKQVGKSDTFSPDNSPTFGKCRCRSQDMFRTERAVRIFRKDCQVPINAAFDTLRAYPAA